MQDQTTNEDHELFDAPGKRLLSEREAALYLGAIAQRTLQHWRTQRAGPAYVRIGRRIGYRVADLDAFLSAGRVEPKVGAAA